MDYTIKANHWRVNLQPSSIPSVLCPCQRMRKHCLPIQPLLIFTVQRLYEFLFWVGPIEKRPLTSNGSSTERWKTRQSKLNWHVLRHNFKFCPCLYKDIKHNCQMFFCNHCYFNARFRPLWHNSVFRIGCKTRHEYVWGTSVLGTRKSMWSYQGLQTTAIIRASTKRLLWTDVKVASNLLHRKLAETLDWESHQTTSTIKSLPLTTHANLGACSCSARARHLLQTLCLTLKKRIQLLKSFYSGDVLGMLLFQGF